MAGAASKHVVIFCFISILLCYCHKKTVSDIVECIVTTRARSASVVRLDARPTGNQEVEGLTLPGRQHSFVTI